MRAIGRALRIGVPAWQGWLPWVVVSVVVIVWTSFKVAAIGQQTIAWPGLHKAISITLYNDKPYAAIWAFQPLGTGTAILLAAIITALVGRLPPRAFFELRRRHDPAGLAGGHDRDAHRRPRLSDELFGHGLYARPSGASTGHAFRAAFALPGLGRGLPVGQRHVGQRAVRQSAGRGRPAARPQPVLFAATNSSGGVMGKMISPQNIATGVAVTNLRGQEGVVFARTFWHSIVLTLILGVLVAMQQFVFPGIIPVVPH